MGQRHEEEAIATGWPCKLACFGPWGLGEPQPGGGSVCQGRQTEVGPCLLAVALIRNKICLDKIV